MTAAPVSAGPSRYRRRGTRRYRRFAAKADSSADARQSRICLLYTHARLPGAARSRLRHQLAEHQVFHPGEADVRGDLASHRVTCRSLSSVGQAERRVCLHWAPCLAASGMGCMRVQEAGDLSLRRRAGAGEAVPGSDPRQGGRRWRPDGESVSVATIALAARPFRGFRTGQMDGAVVFVTTLTGSDMLTETSAVLAGTCDTYATRTTLDGKRTHDDCWEDDARPGRQRQTSHPLFIAVEDQHPPSRRDKSQRPAADPDTAPLTSVSSSVTGERCSS